MPKHPLFAVLGLALFATLGAWGLARAAVPSATRVDGRPDPTRIVSLAPAITETLFEIGAFPNVVGVSRFCSYPPEVERLPRVGTSITPSYERLAELDPTLIVSERNVSAKARELAALGPTRLLPWLTLDEISSSIRELGRLTGREQAADALAARLRARLAVGAPELGPRVLLVLGYAPGKLDEVYFIRRNSLHGAALHAAGGRNAVERDVTGVPRLDLSSVVAIDPDIVIVLSVKKAAAEQLRADWSRLSVLSAVKNSRVSAIEAPEAYANGPRILGLVDRLQAEIARLSAAADRVPGSRAADERAPPVPAAE
jgi:iron complex transport system substrate-binding protein